MLPRLLLGTAVALCVAAPAADAASVVYGEGGNIVAASPDGAHKLALTTDGTPVAPYYSAAQSAGGVTVAARQEQLDTMRAVLHAFSPADGKETAANVLPRASFATDAVMPIRLDIDPAGDAVAFGYSTCGLGGGCINRTYGYWLTFAQHGPANPSSPQGSTGLLAPSFHGNRIVSSDGFKVMVQEAGNAPFNDGHAGWIDPGDAGARFWAAEVAPDGRAIALEYSDASGRFGVVLAAGDGTLGGATELKCFLPAAGEAQDVSWSPDGTMLAWADDEGVKVARAPDLARPPAAEDKCVLGSTPVVLSPTGTDPNFGGADVAAMIAARGKAPGAPAPVEPGPGTAPGAVAVSAPKRATLERGVKVAVTAPGAGRVVAKLLKGRKVVGSGRTTAAGAGDMQVKVKLRRGIRARTLRGARLTLRVVWSGDGGASSTATATVRAR